MHTHIYTYTTLTDVHMHADVCTHSLPMGVDGATVTCGLNVPEEDKYSYNHSKKVHSTSRAALDKQMIPISRL